MDQELTIDTSSCSGPCSSVSAQTPSPCFSRLSTRSSTIPSLSSLSPTGSCSLRSRNSPKGILACPLHSKDSSSQEVTSTCAECQLIRQSAAASPFNSHNHPPLLQKSLPTQLTVQTNFSIETDTLNTDISPFSGGERRSGRKRRKSSAYSADEYDISPPRLEKIRTFSLHSNGSDSDLPLSPDRLASSQKSPSNVCRGRPQAPSRGGKSQRPVIKSKYTKKKETSQKLSRTNKTDIVCNTLDEPSHSVVESDSVITDSAPPDSDCQPLPLKFCTKRKLVQEIKAALKDDR